jgi:hypothetical protein
VRTDLGPLERRAAWAVAGLVGTLGVVGFGVSATNVAEAVEPSFGELAWTVPFGVDVGIAAFTGLDLLMARMDMRSRWLRIVPWALIAVTVYLNVAGEPDMLGKVAHAVLPLTWVVAVEAGAHILRTWAGLHATASRMDRVRRSRWLLAPLATVKLWRRMVLWEERSYLKALQRERDRVLALCDLQEGHGRVTWRWKAPRRLRALYRLGELSPVELTPEPAPVSVQAPVARLAPPRTNGSHKLSVDEAARVIYDQEKVAGRPLSDRGLVRKLKEADPTYALGRARARVLLERFANETTEVVL